MLRPLPQPASRMRACCGSPRSLMTRFRTVRRPRYHQCLSSARWVCSSYSRSIRAGSFQERSSRARWPISDRSPAAPDPLVFRPLLRERRAQELDRALPSEIGGLTVVGSQAVGVVEERMSNALIGVCAHVDARAAHLLLERLRFVERNELVLGREVGEHGAVD